MVVYLCFRAVTASTEVKLCFPLTHLNGRKLPVWTVSLPNYSVQPKQTYYFRSFLNPGKSFHVSGGKGWLF